MSDQDAFNERAFEKLRSKEIARDARTPKEKKTRNILIGVLVSLVAFFGIIIASVGGGGSNTTSTDTSSTDVVPTPTASPDIVGQVACEDFRSMMSDISKNLITDSEMRVAIKKVYSDGQYATTPAIVTDSTQMLAADTTGDSTALGKAFIDMGTGCGAIGY